MTTDPPTTARLEFVEPYEPLLRDAITTRYCIVTGGRGSGKSFAVTTALAMMLRKAGMSALFTRYTMIAAVDSIIPEFMEKIELLQCAGEFTASQHAVIHCRGSSILFRGIKVGSLNQTAKLKSLQGINVWVLDEAAELADPVTFETIDLSVRDSRRPNLVLLVLNPPHKAHWMYSRFFADIPPEFCGVRGDVTYIHTTYLDNKPNLPEGYLRLAADMKAANPTRYAHIWRGHWADAAEGALWTWEMIDRHRHRESAKLPEFCRVVVAIDPAVTSSDTSDETGIVCVAMDFAGHYYVLSDLTCRASPMQWATVAIGEYKTRSADRIVAEVNNGGDLVEATLRNVDRSVAYGAVHASRGKIVRAEPVAALYEQGLVHHVGAFPALETELMTYAGKSNDASPNRLDALVWALSSLMDSSGRAELASASSMDPGANRRPRDFNRLDLSPDERRARREEESYADVY